MEDAIDNLIYFFPFVVIFIIMLIDGRFGIDRIETDNSDEHDKTWLNQKVTVGRNPHLEYSTSPSKSKRWKILLFWFIPCLAFYLFKTL